MRLKIKKLKIKSVSGSLVAFTPYVVKVILCDITNYQESATDKKGTPFFHHHICMQNTFLCIHIIWRICPFLSSVPPVYIGTLKDLSWHSRQNSVSGFIYSCMGISLLQRNPGHNLKRLVFPPHTALLRSEMSSITHQAYCQKHLSNLSPIVLEFSTF